MCHFNPLFRVCNIDLLSLIYMEVWSGGGSFLKNFQEGGEGNSKILVIFHVVFVATELHPDILFFQHFLTWQHYEN